MSNAFYKESEIVEVGSMGSGLRHPICIWVISLSLLVLMAVVGCGVEKATPTPVTPPVTISLGTAPSSLTVGQTYQFSATVSNTSNTAVTWAVSGVEGGNSTVGTISSSGLYAAPSMVPTPQGVQITATSQADSTKSVSASVTINISFEMDESTASMLVTSTHQFIPTIAGTTDTAVNWTVNGITGGNSTVGTISATGLYTAPRVPPAPSTVTVTGTSAAYSSMSCSIAITVLPPPLTVSVNPSALDLQVSGTVQLADTVTTTSNLPFSSAVTWGVKSPGNSGIAKYGYITTSGLYTAPTTVPAGALNPIPIYVVSQEDPAKFAISYVTVTTAPVLLTISTTTLANGVANTPYSTTISAFGGAQPYAWSVPANTLPPGLTLNSSTGVVSGTPTAAGTFPFTVTATDQTSPTHEMATANLSITIIPQLTIATATLPSGSAGANYSASLNATGGVGPYTWTITSGTLPSGLSLTGSTIAGTPATGTGSTTGTQYPLTLKVTDSGTPQQTQTFSPILIVYLGPVITTTSPINTAFVGQPYTFTVQTVGGAAPYTWTYANLPSWLSVTPSTGLTSTIGGNPATVAPAAAFTVKVTDSNGVSNSVNLIITVSNVFAFPTVTMPNGVINNLYSQVLTASGGTAPYTWKYTGLPAWLSAAPSTGLTSTISGTPTTAGPYSFSVSVTDSSTPAQVHSQNLSFTIYAGLTITTTSLPNGIVGRPYSQPVTVAGGVEPYTWSISAGALPTCLSLASATTSTGSNTLAGTPAAGCAGASNFTVKVVDSSSPPQTKTQPFSVTIYTALNFPAVTLPGGAVGTAYSGSLTVSGGTEPYTWSISAGTLPACLSIASPSTTTGSNSITGTPVTSCAGNFSFTVKVTDSSSPAQVATQSMSVTILGITTTSLPAASLGVAYNQTLSAVGGSGSYTWSISAGTFPASTCLALTTSTGAITGTPVSGCSNTYNFTVQVKDTSTPALITTQALSITINTVGVSITSPANLTQIVGTDGTLVITASVTGTTDTAVTWTVNGVTNGNTTYGTITGTGLSVMYNAPAAVPSPATFNVTVTSAADNTKSASVSVTITPVVVTVTITSPTNLTQNVTVNGTLAITASVTNTSNTAVTWTVNGVTNGNSTYGTIVGSGLSVTYDAPAAVPSPATFNVTATSQADPSKSAAVNVTITGVLAIVTTTLPGAWENVAYDQLIQTNNGGKPPITWSISTGTLPPGYTLQSTSSGSGLITGTYTTAPPSSEYVFTVKATDSSSPAETATQQLMIGAQGAPETLYIITATLPNGTVNTAYNAPLVAAGGKPPYIWTVASGSTMPTWVNLSGSGTSWTLSGTPTAAATSSFTLQVADSSSPPETDTVALSLAIVNPQVCSTGNEAALKGQYAFSLGGYGTSGFLAAIGSFTADGSGHITAGTVDANGDIIVTGNGLGYQSGSINAGSSSYTFGADNRGCATITTPFYTFITRFALQPNATGNAQGRIEEWDAGSDPYIASGQIFQQNFPATVPNGVWVYAERGAAGTGGRVALVGTRTASGGDITSGEFDFPYFGSTYQGLVGTYTTPDPTTGRLTIATTAKGDTVTRVAYKVSGTQQIEMTAWSDLNPQIQYILLGTAQLQSGALTLSGNLVYFTSGYQGGGFPYVNFATINANSSASSYTGNNYENSGGQWSTGSPTCAYTIDSYGRVATSGTNCGTFNYYGPWSYPPVFYLTGPNTGFLLGSDPEYSLGALAPQSATAITAGTYTFGTQEILLQSMNESMVGNGTLSSAGDFTGTGDDTSLSSPLQGDESISATLTVNSDGTFSTSANPGVIAGVIISGSQFIKIDLPEAAGTSLLIYNAATAH